MLDFTELEVSTTSLPKLSVDTPTVLDNLPVINLQDAYDAKIRDDALRIWNEKRTTELLAPWIDIDEPTNQKVRETKKEEVIE